MPVSRIAGEALVATALLACAPFALALGEPSTAGVPSIDADTSLLVVAPHPDDETLCCAGLMQRVRAAGGRVNVVWITSGDGSVLSMLSAERSLLAPRAKVEDLARKRMQEARAATSLLGVPRAQQFFLGYPDGGIRKLLADSRSQVHAAKFTGTTHVPYADAFAPGHPYTRENLESDFDAVLQRVRPTLVLAPSTEDTHPDHHASGLLAMQAVGRSGLQAKLRFWIVHDGEGWPSPRGLMPSIPLITPKTRHPAAWVSFPLTASEEARKQDAIRLYRTQMRVMAPFLLGFVRTSELYSASSP